jgi:hypothetical protein
MKYYLNEQNRISVNAIGELPPGVQEVTFDEGISASDYNNDIDAGRNKYIIDENVVKLRPLTPEEVEAAEQARSQAEYEAKMSATITPRQMRLYLYQKYNITSAQLDALVSGDEAARIELEYATVIYKRNRLIEVFAAQLGLDEDAITQLFNEAVKL